MSIIDVTRTHEVIDALFANEVVGIPTDTVYGLAAMPNRTAIKRMIDLKKGRDKDQPIAILFSELEKLEQYGVDFKKIRSLGVFWPGALTVVTSASTHLLPIPVVTEEGTVGVRIPDNEIAIQIIENVVEYWRCPARTIMETSQPSMHRKSRNYLVMNCWC